MSNEKLKEGIKKIIDLKSNMQLDCTNELGVHDLTVKQIGYIKKMDIEGGITSSQIAEMFHISKPTVTEMIKRYQAFGYIYKENCSEDGRIVFIKLTDKGKGIARLGETAVDHLAEELEKKLDEEDINELTRILNKI